VKLLTRSFASCECARETMGKKGNKQSQSVGPNKRASYQEEHDVDEVLASTPLLGGTSYAPVGQRLEEETSVEILDSDSTRIPIQDDDHGPYNHHKDDDTSSLNSHDEPHFGNAEVVRDIVIGLSDGLTVPFALAAGLATLNNSHLVVTAGLAGMIAFFELFKCNVLTYGV
jgi:hypothetical protein